MINDIPIHNCILVHCIHFINQLYSPLIAVYLHINEHFHWTCGFNRIFTTDTWFCLIWISNASSIFHFVDLTLENLTVFYFTPSPMKKRDKMVSSTSESPIMTCISNIRQMIMIFLKSYAFHNNVVHLRYGINDFFVCQTQSKQKSGWNAPTLKPFANPYSSNYYIRWLYLVTVTTNWVAANHIHLITVTLTKLLSYIFWIQYADCTALALMSINDFFVIHDCIN